MVSFQSIRKTFLPNLGVKPAAPDLEALRELCFALLADVPASDRKAMLLRIENMRRAEDTWYLRGALFDVISLFHGEATARERLATLDERLR